MKKKSIILIICVVLFIVVGIFLHFYFESSLVSKKDSYDELFEDEEIIKLEDVRYGDMSISDDIMKFSIDKEEYVFSKGDNLNVNFWDEEEKEIYFNDEQIKSIPILYGGITIGSKVESVIDVFNIQPGYANINMEISTEEQDGTTDVIEFSYEDISFLKKDYLDAYITFGYKKVDGSWKMVNADDLMKLIDSNQTEGLLVYIIDINGLDEEAVSVGEVILFDVEYFKY